MFVLKKKNQETSRKEGFKISHFIFKNNFPGFADLIHDY